MSAPLLVDTHCHVQFQAYHADWEKIVREALAAETWMITVGTQTTTSAEAVSFAEKFSSGLYAAVGLHPSHLYSSQLDQEELKIKTRAERFDQDYYQKLVQNPKVVAVGECGIDLHYLPDKTDRDEALALQEDQFRQQLALANANDLPVIVHCRDEHQEIIRILSDVIRGGEVKRRGVIHSYTGTWENAEKYIEMGFSIGFNGIITFPSKKGMEEKHEALLETVRKIPLEKLLVETDAPYLSPVPHRGERNHPKHVKHVAEKIAELKDLAYSEVAKISTANALRIFNRIHVDNKTDL